jgi:hypothetical protein
MRGRAIAGLVSLLIMMFAAPAAAYWHAGGAGSGQAPVDTLAGGNQPTASASGSTVTVQWTQSALQGSPIGGYSGGGYTIRRYPASGGAAVTPNGGCAATISGMTATLSCQDSAVPAGSWRYTVAPLLKSWTGAESPTSAAVTVAPATPTLTSVAAQNPATGQTTGNIQISWGAATGATGYNLYRRTSIGAYDFSTPLNGAIPLTATSYSDPESGLTGATTYAYVVRATNGAESPNSNELSATAIARPAAPASVTATPAAGGQINVGWSSVSGVAGYNIYRRTTASAYNYATPLNGATPATGTTSNDTSALNATSYRYVIRAVSTGAGGAQVESVDSTESPAATADSTPPSAVTLTDPGSPLRGSVTLSGAASDSGSGIASLRFQTTPAGGSTWTDGCTATTSPYSCNLATGALTDGLYDLRVLATDTAGNTTTSSVVTNRRVDNTAPSATMSDPGAFLRATVTLTATASDTGSGLATLRIQRAPTGSSTWTDVCTTTTSPANCALNTTTLTDGGYDLQAIATDLAGNTTTSALVSNRVIDNTAPTGLDVQTANAAGGTAGKPETGDTLTYTFSEPMLPGSVLSGWTGAATPVVVRITNGNPDVITVYNSTNTTQLALGSVSSGKKYVTATTTFTASTMILTGTTITLTLGTPSGSTSTANGTTTLQWTTSTAATDRAGNPLTAATVLETGTADLDF